MTTPPTPKRPWYRKPWGIGLLVILGLAVIGGIVGGDEEDKGEQPTTTTVETTTTTTQPTTTTTQPTTTTTQVELTTDDFLIELFVIEDECFGSAGALVTVEPDLTYVGANPYPGGEHLLVFEISGVEGGTETYNLTVHDDGNYTYNQEMLSTTSCDYNLGVEVVGVRSR